jgi:uncharacterized repeat protein (TIGR01451 family)
MKQLILVLLTLLTPSAALAANNVALSSEVLIERKVVKPDGKIAVMLEAPNTVVPGDELIFVVNYQNVGGSTARDIVVTNPMPKAVRFGGTTDGNEWVSIDGGRNWGRLAQLTVREADGSVRAARPADVTHIQWRLNTALAAGSAGKLIFRGTVR